MWYEAELVVKNYKPLKLEEGMLFVQKLHQGTLKENIELFILERVPLDEEAFIAQNGYPVELYVIGENDNILASNEEIALWDEGHDELFEISVDHVNIIFNDYDGVVQIEMMDVSDPESEYEEYVPVIYEGNVILRYPQDEYEEYYEEEDEEDEYENYYICSLCNGSGEGFHDGSSCAVCKGTGVEYITKENL